MADDKCPKCGDVSDGGTYFRCGSQRFYDGGFWIQSDRCRIRELERELAEAHAAIEEKDLAISRLCLDANKARQETDDIRGEYLEYQKIGVEEMRLARQATAAAEQRADEAWMDGLAEYVDRLQRLLDSPKGMSLPEDAEHVYDAAVKMKQETAEAVDALQELYDWQNGPPLIEYTERWQAAMDRALAVLGKAGGESRQQQQQPTGDHQS